MTVEKTGIMIDGKEVVLIGNPSEIDEAKYALAELTKCDK